MRIGIIGSGHIGSTVGKLWAKAGHQVMFSSRHPEALSGLASQAGSSASIGTVQEAVVFGDVLFLSIPFAALPDLAKDLLPQLEGKIVLETANPYPERDGPMAQEVRDSGRGTGAYLREWFPRASGSSGPSTAYGTEHSPMRRIVRDLESAYPWPPTMRRPCRLRHNSCGMPGSTR